MTAVLLLSIGIAAAAVAGAVALFVRSGETRIGWFIALPALLACGQGMALWLAWGQPLGFDVATVGVLLGLVASGVTAAVLPGLAHTLAERDRAEEIHWEAMQAIRALGELDSPRPELGAATSSEEKLRGLLEIGRRCFELETGILARLDGESFVVTGDSVPEGHPEPAGRFLRSESLCGIALRSERPLAIEDVSESSLVENGGARLREQRAYLGMAVRTGDEVYGTLSFASAQPRVTRFTATDKDLLVLMAGWVSHQIERTRTSRAVEGRAAETGEKGRKLRLPAPAVAATETARPAGLPTPAGVDANAILLRLERKLARVAGPAVQLEVTLAPGLARAHAPGVPLEDILKSLTRYAVDAMPDGGRLRIETAKLDTPALAGGGPTPAAYVTLSLHHGGGGAEAEAFARAFDASMTAKRSEPPGAGLAAVGGDPRLTLAAIRRALRHSGGDLSLDHRPRRGATLTLYLRCAPAATQSLRTSGDVTAPAGAGTRR